MALEDFSTYTEVDPDTNIVIGTRRVEWTDVSRDEEAYVYIDKTADYFDGDFTHYMTTNCVSSVKGVNERIAPWVMANLVDDIRGIDEDSAGDALFLIFVHPNSPDEVRLKIYELDSGTLYTGAAQASSYYVITQDTPYYLTIYRDESAGTYGTFYCKVYTDPARTANVATLSVALHTSKKDFRYLYPMSNWATGSAYLQSGYSQNLELTAALETPTVTTELLTDISGTTATGNGTIVSTGISSVTAHGMVWATTIDPDTGDSSTDEGAGSVGAFTSSITGLIEGQEYYFRAYATNTQGTSYGNNVKLTGGFAGSQLEKGNLSVVETRLHYVDADGKERYIEGTLV